MFSPYAHNYTPFVMLARLQSFVSLIATEHDEDMTFILTAEETVLAAFFPF